MNENIIVNHNYILVQLHLVHYKIKEISKLMSLNHFPPCIPFPVDLPDITHVYRLIESAFLALFFT